LQIITVPTDLIALSPRTASMALVSLLAGLWMAFGLLLGMTFPESWMATLASAQLAVTGRLRTPVGLMDFLEDARERNVLRTVGPVYQFRHARLQELLVARSI